MRSKTHTAEAQKRRSNLQEIQEESRVRQEAWAAEIAAEKLAKDNEKEKDDLKRERL